MNSKILLVKNIYIDRQYTNVLSYSEAQMLELCQANLVAQADNYSFLRPTGSIMAGFTYAQCLQANYIAFQNLDYSNKWFFAWINDVIYKGDKNTEITFTVDAWSTWFDKWNKKVCFINRQHVNDDTIGLHTITENLDVGEVVQESITEDLTYGNDFGYWIAVASNWQIKDGSTGKEILESDKGKQNSGITVYDNTVFGTQLFFFKIIELSSFIDLELLLLRTNADGHIGDVQNIFNADNANDIEKTYTQEDLIRIMKYHMLLCKHIYGMEIINFKEYEDKVCTLETFNHQRSLFKTHERCYLFSGIAEFVLNYSKEEFYPIITEDVSIEIEDLYD